MKFRAKLTLEFFFVAVLILLLISLSLGKYSLDLQMRELRSALTSVASLAAVQIDAKKVSSIRPSEESDKLQSCIELRTLLSSILKTNPKIKDVYIMVKTDKENTLKFIANAAPDVYVPCGKEYDISKFPAMSLAFERPTADKELTADEWGNWLSGYAPIKDATGATVAIVGVDISATTVIEILDAIKLRFAIVFVVGALLAISLGSIVSGQISKPISTLAFNMEKAKNGNLDLNVKLDTKDEIQLLADTFNKMLIDLKKYIAEIQVMTAEKERAKKELEIARQLQISILPIIPSRIDGLDVAAVCMPAKEVGGDFFDYLELDKHHIGFVIADASGKGLPGALLMTNTRSVFRAYAHGSNSTGKVLELSNKLISQDMASTGRFITFFYAMFDPETHNLTYSNAGHNPPILFKNKDKKAMLLDSISMPLGVMEDQKFDERHMSLEKDDLIVFYTDGVTEAQNSQGEMFGEKRLMDLIIENKGKDAKQVLSAIKETVWNFVRDEPQYDDFTVLVIKGGHPGYAQPHPGSTS